jgi:uncharacterized protein DUF6776
MTPLWSRLTAALVGSAGAPRVVHRDLPALRIALLVATALVALFALYVIYELGRYDAGYDRQAAAEQRTELAVQIEHLQKDNRDLRTRLAELDAIRLGRAREQAEVARELGDLQAQVARQSQELSFYRGVVSQTTSTTTPGLKIEQLRITAGPKPATYVVHMSLVRSGRADTSTSGTVRLSLDGSSAGRAQSLDLATLTGGRMQELRYSFHYLQTFDEELALPGAFKPERLAVEVESSRHDVPALSQTFLWTVEASQ